MTATNDPRIVQVSQKGVMNALEYLRLHLLNFRITHSKD